jgi:hypothetical protein
MSRAAARRASGKERDPLMAMARPLALRRLGLGWVLAITLCGSGGGRAAVVVQGKILDGPASAAQATVQSFREGEAWHVPVAARKVEIRALGAEPHSWTLETGGDGSFTLDTGLDALPAGTPFVAVAESSGQRLYSPSFDPSEKDLVVFVYPAGADARRVETVTTIVHDVEKSKVDGEERRLLRVQYRVEFWNFAAELYVGEEIAAGREVYRIPIPPGARLRINRGPVPGTRWKHAEDGRFLVIDEPVPGIPDLVHSRKTGRSRIAWEVEYLVEPTAFFTLEYPLALEPAARGRGMELGGFAVYVRHEDMKLEGSEEERASDGEGASMEVEATHFAKAQEVERNPIDGARGKYDVYVPSGPGARVARGFKVLVPVEISDVARGLISRKALFWHGGTVLIGLAAIGLGLFFGRRRPPPEAALEGLSSEEVLDRIAELDASHERGEIRDADYRRYRESLVAIAADEIAGAESAQRATGPSPRAVLGERTRAALAELSALDGKEATGADLAELIQKRAHLLEALYASLRKDLES